MSLLAAMALAVGGTPGTTGRWWYMFADADMAWFADTLTIVQEGDTVDLTYETVYRTPKDNVSYRVRREYVDCATRRTRMISNYAFAIDGRPVPRQSAEGPFAWQTVLPDSNGESVLVFACTTLQRWPERGGLAVFRPPERVARDFYWLVTLGLHDEDAIKLARLDRATRLPEIEHFIRQHTSGKLRAQLLEAYGLSRDGPVT